MVVDLNQKVNEIYRTPSDINQHIPAIIEYGSKCNHITEMGVRWVVSTWAWLATAPKKLIAYDLYNPLIGELILLQLKKQLRPIT